MEPEDSTRWLNSHPSSAPASASVDASGGRGVSSRPVLESPRNEHRTPVITRLEAAASRLQQSVARLESAIQTRAREDGEAAAAGAALGETADAARVRLDSVIDRLRRVLEA